MASGSPFDLPARSGAPYDAGLGALQGTVGTLGSRSLLVPWRFLTVGPYELSGLASYRPETLFNFSNPRATDQLVPVFTSQTVGKLTPWNPAPDVFPGVETVNMVYLRVPYVGPDWWIAYFPLSLPDGAILVGFRARYLYVEPESVAPGKPAVRQFRPYVLRTRYAYSHGRHEVMARLEYPKSGLANQIEPGSYDAAGNEVEREDGRGALTLSSYDAGLRPVRTWARDADGEAVTLRQHILYGDDPESGLTEAEARERNLLGLPYQHYDEAGRLTVEQLDHKGNVLHKRREVLGVGVLLGVFTDAAANDWEVAPFRVDWEPSPETTLAEHAAGLLSETVYETEATYDALSRLVELTLPEDPTGARRRQRHTYNRAGTLERVELRASPEASPEAEVEHIAYNARGQRILVALGNGIMTRYAYDPDRFRLALARSEEYDPGALPDFARPTAVELRQNLACEYDLAGNVTRLVERTSESGSPDADRTFTYDALYRLTSATGREHDLAIEPPPWEEGSGGTDLTAVRLYTETYAYDAAGNLTELQHLAPGGATSGTYTRTYTIDEGSNRLTAMDAGETSYPYTTDAAGNVTQETTSRHLEWDSANRLRVYRTQTEGAEPTIHAQYAYDPAGQRVIKLVRKPSAAGRYEVAVYIDGLYEHRWEVDGTDTTEQAVLHLTDGAVRYATVRAGDAFEGDTLPAVQYELHDHLNSSRLTLDDAGAIVHREEYTPYGESSYGQYGRRRYRYSGKERDGESGLYYFGARYYAAWLGRWASTDPAGVVDGLNLYGFARLNPLGYVDPDGRESSKTSGVAPEQSSMAGKVSSYTDDKGAVHYRVEGVWREIVDRSNVKYPALDMPGFNNVAADGTFNTAGADALRSFTETAGKVVGVGVAVGAGVGMIALGGALTVPIQEGLITAGAAVEAAAPTATALTMGVARALSETPAPTSALGSRATAALASKAAGQAFGGLSRAAEFGIKPYNQLAKTLRGSGLHTHHLIEQRFAGVLGQNARHMSAVAVTKAEHQAFTNAWRARIPYGPSGTGAATRESVMQAARDVYAQYPEILKALGL